MADTDWGAFRLRLTARLADDEYEIQQFLGSFELNAIPRCSLSLAVGRNAQTLLPATAHSGIGKLEPGDPLTVFLQVLPLGHQGKTPRAWPAKAFKIFEGNVVGAGWQRGTQNAAFTIHAEHWLAKLNYSSALSGSSHPGNPSDFTYMAGFTSNFINQGGGDPLHWVPHVNVDGTITLTDLETDLWEKVIKRWMVAVSNQDPIDSRLSDDVKNTAALEALARIKSEAMAMALTSGIDGTAIGNAVVWDMNKAMGRADIHNTLWGKLIGEWAVSYWFALVPRVDDAIIVPFTGGLRGQPWALLRNSDYVQCDLTTPMPQLLRSVGIALSTAYEAGGNSSPAAYAVPRTGLAGLYKSKRKNPTGLVLIKDAPRWLSDPVQGYRYGKVTAGVNPRVPIRMVITPDDVGPPPPPGATPAQNQQKMKTILDKLAHQWFVIEMLKGRTGEISGRLRFDIAPGSQVCVEGGIDPFVKTALGADLLGSPFYAIVSRVTQLIDAEAQKAGTSFTVTHIRNELENHHDDTSVKEPPLYKKGWIGKALIDGFVPGA